MGDWTSHAKISGQSFSFGMPRSSDQIFALRGETLLLPTSRWPIIPTEQSSFFANAARLIPCFVLYCCRGCISTQGSRLKC